MICTLCNNEVEVLAQTNQGEICLICLAQITKHAFQYGKSFNAVLANKLAKAGGINDCTTSYRYTPSRFRITSTCIYA